MKLAALISGGKDSLYAAYLESKENEISYIISIISENPESYMFHVPNAELVEEQAESMNIPIIQRTTKGEKEKELEDLENALTEINVDGLVSGAIQSSYQKKRIDKICEKLGIKSVIPLWQKNPEELLRNMIKEFEIIITSVAAPPLDESWLGRKIDEKCVEELVKLNEKHGIHILFEGGEGETFVLNCPLFNKRIEIVDSEKIWDENSGTLKIKKIELQNK